MRLPADATLIVAGAGPEGTRPAAVAALVAAFRREGLPVEATGPDAFADGRLAARLDDLGATTLVLCGEETAVSGAARAAEALGFHVFVVSDACWTDAAGARLPKGSAIVVDCATALAAAALAKARQRRNPRRQGPG